MVIPNQTALLFVAVVAAVPPQEVEACSTPLKVSVCEEEVEPLAIMAITSPLKANSPAIIVAPAKVLSLELLRLKFP